MNGHYLHPPGPRSPAVRPALAGLLVLVVLLGAGCSSTIVKESPATASPSAPAAATATDDTDAWAFADVAEPDIVTQAPSLEPGYQCSPCHPAAASQLFGLATTLDGLLAVGVQQPPAIAIAVTSVDGRRWDRVTEWDPGERTTAIAAASNGSRTVVVGSGPAGAAAWLRAGGSWSAATSDDLDGLAGATAMTAVAAWRGGFVAGGFRDDPARGLASAAAWRSGDGRTWRRDDAADAFAGGRILGIASREGVVVAVGSGGDPSYGPAAAWVLVGGAWRRASVAEAGGLMRAVTATTDGFVAVGQAEQDDRARVWTSSDGLSWTPLADQAAFDNRSGPSRMQAVARDGHGLLAGGWRADAGNGSVAAWTSPDGLHWEAATWVPAFAGGQIRGVAFVGDAALGVGRSGYPDNNQAAAWIRGWP